MKLSLLSKEKMQKNETKAWTLTSYGDANKAFEVRTIPLRTPGNHEVHISVEAFGLNYADVMARRKLYREAPPLPAVIGYEVVGTIVAIGKDVDPAWLSKRVVAFTRFGGYARDVITFDYAVAEIGSLPAEEAMALSTQFVTAHYMANVLTNILPGDRVLIHAAAGGVGTALIQLAKAKGAIVYAKIGTSNKEAVVKKLGADFVVNYNVKDYEQTTRELLAGSRLDISFNPVAGSTFQKDWRLLGSGGRLVLFGGSERTGKKWGVLSTLNFVRKMGLVIPIGLMMRSKNILGINMLKIADNKPEVLTHCLREVVRMRQHNEIHVEVGATFPSERLPEAHTLLESGKSVGKITVFW